MIHIYFVCISSSWRRASTRGPTSVSGGTHHLHCLPLHNDIRPRTICFLPLVGRKRYSWYIYIYMHQWTYSIHIWCIYDILYLMYDIIQLMTLLVNIWYVCSYTTLSVIIIYYVFVNVLDIIGYNFILYVCSCMTLN